MPHLSVVVPVYNEVDNVDALRRRARARAATARAVTYEIIFVDDGSSDGTLRAAASTLRRDDPRVRRRPSRRATSARRRRSPPGSTHARGDDPRHHGRRPAERSGRHPAPARDRSTRATTWCAAGAATAGRPLALAPAAVAARQPADRRDRPASRSTTTAARSKVFRGDLARSARASTARCTASSRRSPTTSARRVDRDPGQPPAARAGKSKYGISRTVRVMLDLLTVKFLSGFSPGRSTSSASFGLVSTCMTGLLITGCLGLRAHRLRGVRSRGRPLVLLGILLVVMRGAVRHAWVCSARCWCARTTSRRASRSTASREIRTPSERARHRNGQSKRAIGRGWASPGTSDAAPSGGLLPRPARSLTEAL